MSDDLTVLGLDGIRRSYDEHYDTMMDVEQDPTGAHEAIQRQHSRIEELEAKLAKANDHIEGLEELLWAAEKDASEAEAYAGELEAKLAKAVKLIELAIELGRWELNPSFRDELIAFTAELTSSVAADNQVKGGKDE